MKDGHAKSGAKTSGQSDSQENNGLSAVEQNVKNMKTVSYTHLEGSCTPAEYYGSETGAFIFQCIADRDDLPGYFVLSLIHI